MDRTTTAQPLRDELLDATIALLATRGPAAVQARTVAAEAGTSTMMVYKLFGSMPALLGAACDEGFRRLALRFDGAPRSEDAVADAAVLALVHRAVARENPHLYDLMFGLATPSATQDALGFAAAYAQLQGCAEAVVASGRIRPAAPEAVAAQLWSFVHGAITLELAGHLERFDEVLLTLACTVMVGLGDEPARAQASAEAARAAVAGRLSAAE
ncbi:MAG: transcriptional regulator [Conexibacter sp.]|nr:transcriptional regulator [Conexibacter sp.]